MYIFRKPSELIVRDAERKSDADDSRTPTLNSAIVADTRVKYQERSDPRAVFALLDRIHNPVFEAQGQSVENLVERQFTVGVATTDD